MELLSRQVGPLPLWGWAVIIVAVGIGVYIWYRNNFGGGSNAASTSGVAGATSATNPYNPTNDPNIDPNTGVPYQLEEAINPQTGAPYYFSPPAQSSPTATTTTTPTTTTTGTDPDKDKPPATTTTGSDPDKDNPPAGGTRPPVKHKGDGPETSYTFQPIGATGQTAPLSSVAISAYGVSGHSDIMRQVSRIINANPGLRGKPSNYQPPVGTTIVLPTP